MVNNLLFSVSQATRNKILYEAEWIIFTERLAEDRYLRAHKVAAKLQDFMPL